MSAKIKCCEYDNESHREKLSIIVQKYLKNIIAKEDFETYDVIVNDISTCGGNYLGTLQTVAIKEKTKGSKVIHLFIKNIIQSHESFEYFSLDEVYMRESFVYTELFDKYNRLQEEYHIPLSKRFKNAKCYNDLNSEAIILEDLTKVGFETCQRRDVMSLKFAERSISQLAKFHALSFVLQRQQPLYFDEKIKSIKAVFNLESDWQSFIKRTCDEVSAGLEGEVRIRLERYCPSFFDRYKQFYKMPDDECICLCHGDFRVNNVMMKKVNGDVTEVIPVDYQLVNFSNPVLDILYFIFGGSDQKFRLAYLDHLKDYYYDELESFLKYFDIRVDEVYSRKRYNNDFKQNLDFGLISSVILMPFLFATDDDVPDIKNGLESMSYNLDPSYKQRMSQIVDDFIRWGYL